MRWYFLLCLSLLPGCNRSSEEYSAADPISVKDGKILVQSSSKFVEQINIVGVSPAPGGEKKLRAVGQMVAMANSSGDLLKEGVSWVLLDADLVRSLGLPLAERAPVGLSFGVTSLPAGYRNEIHPGERVELFRYGLKQGSTTGSIVAIRKSGTEAGEDTVIFSVLHGLDWYPGTNCEVEFPLVHRQAVTISPLSMLHEGLRDFVLKETAPGQFRPEEITVVNESKDQVYALGDIRPGDRIVERGAILMKPMVHSILRAERETIHVP